MTEKARYGEEAWQSGAALRQHHIWLFEKQTLSIIEVSYDI